MERMPRGINQESEEEKCSFVISHSRSRIELVQAKILILRYKANVQIRKPERVSLIYTRVISSLVRGHSGQPSATKVAQQAANPHADHGKTGGLGDSRDLSRETC